MYFAIVFISAVIINVQCQETAEPWIVNITQGLVRGFKQPGDAFYSFYNIPYATVRERFKMASLPPTWTEPFEAIDRGIICPQGPVAYLNITGKTMQEDCLVINVFVPQTNETNLPVLVDVHGGAFHAGLGDAYTYNTFATQKNVIVVTYNYRIGVLGFICMGSENIPGNAGMKDLVLGLRWVQNNIASFGGNPDDVTLTGCSAGGTAIDLLLLSNASKGLFHKAIVDSGSNLAAYAIQIDPIEVAKQHARMHNFTDVEDLDALEKFYLTEPFETFISIPSSCGPCVERDVGEEIFLDEAPYTILKNGNITKYPTLYGLTNMEGLFFFAAFEEMSQQMNNNFSDFLPSDLQFSNEEERMQVAESVRYFYFGNQSVADSFSSFVDFLSDSVFVNSKLRTVKMNVEAGHDRFFLHEYSFYDNDSLFAGAPHCAQARAARDEDESNLTQDYMRIKTFVREMWYNFMTTGNPIIDGSPSPSWPPVSQNRTPHLSVGRTVELRGELLPERAQLWDNVYDLFYRRPIRPTRPNSAPLLAPRNVLLVTVFLVVCNIL